MTKRKLTADEEKESARWKRSKRAECGCKVAGHVPDASAGGPATPLDWMKQFKSTNGYIGGIIGRLKEGYTYNKVTLVRDLADCGENK